jgi:murein DD-endopeptidase MepM/ murein hydrolase activator NlpD
MDDAAAHHAPGRAHDDDGLRRASWVGSRRSLLVAGAACCAAFAGARLTGAPVRADGGVARLDQPGVALQTAERLSLRPAPVPAGMLLFPVAAADDCYVLDNFGDARGSTRLHEGIDIMGSRAAPVFAVASGILTKRYTNTGTAGWGWTLRDDDSDTIYKYFHLAEDAVGLTEGSSVSVGQTIGYVGNSGTSGVDNFHLHFEVRPDNVAIDPLPLLVVDPKACGVSPPLRA